LVEIGRSYNVSHSNVRQLFTPPTKDGSNQMDEAPNTLAQTPLRPNGPVDHRPGMVYTRAFLSARDAVKDRLRREGKIVSQVIYQIEKLMDAGHLPSPVPKTLLTFFLIRKK
jgi:hypothetical protein